MKSKSALPKRVTSKNPVVILKAVIKAIQQEPKRYNQSEIVSRFNKREIAHSQGYAPTCGTVACVGGWVNVLTGVSRREEDRLSIAAQTLGLTTREADMLFIGNPAGVPLRGNVTPEQHAAAGVKHIKRFVLKKWGQRI